MSAYEIALLIGLGIGLAAVVYVLILFSQDWDR